MTYQTAVDRDIDIATAGGEFETLELHIASGWDVTDVQDRDSRFRALLARGDLRDQAAERRDRAAEERAPAGADPQGCLDREWAGRDRDAAAIDRADLVALLDEPGRDGQHPTR